MKTGTKKLLLVCITLLMLFSISFVSCPNKTPMASVTYGGVQWNFTKDLKIEDEVRNYLYFTIELQNVKTASDLTTESPIQHWTVTPKIAGTSWKITRVSEDRTNFSLGISGTPTEVLEATPIVVVIPRSALDNPEGVDENKGLAVDMKGSTITVKAQSDPVNPDPSEPDTPAEEVVEPTIAISSVSFEGQPRESLSGMITVTSTGATFKKDLSTAENGVKDWFIDPQDGFTYTLKSIGDVTTQYAQRSVLKEATTKTDKVTIEIKGAFNDESTVDLNYSVKVPATAFNEKVKDSKATEGSGTIKRNIAFKSASWKLYDSATYKNIEADSTVSLNAGLTQYAASENNNTSISLANDLSIASGNKTLVKLERGLARKGYKLVGFAEKDATGAVDVSNVKYSKTLAELQDGFLIPANSDVSLYAVWDVDDSTYWKTIDTVTITKDEIIAANADLKMHDGTTEIPNGYTQSFDFIALPGGRIGGTDDNPTYFEWPVDEAFARTDDDTGAKILHEAIFSDFAIADIPVTGGLYAIVKKWADDNGYNFETGSAYNYYAVGGVKSNVDRFSAEDPTIICNWVNAILFANAMTEWYNEKHPDNQLTPVYVLEDGSIFKDSADTTSYLVYYSTGQGKYSGNMSNKDISKTGFRLPTYTEWLYAASVSPKALDPSWNLEGSASYPFAHSYSYVSGYNGDITTDDNIKQYAVYASLYPEDEGTQVVGKYAGRKKNLLGLYDMSGNVNEYTEDFSNVAPSHTNTRRYYIGGSCLTPKDNTLSIGNSAGSGYGFKTRTIQQLKDKMSQGLRLVRSLNN